MTKNNMYIYPVLFSFTLRLFRLPGSVASWHLSQKFSTADHTQVHGGLVYFLCFKGKSSLTLSLVVAGLTVNLEQHWLTLTPNPNWPLIKISPSFFTFLSHSLLFPLFCRVFYSLPSLSYCTCPLYFLFFIHQCVKDIRHHRWFPSKELCLETVHLKAFIA